MILAGTGGEGRCRRALAGEEGTGGVPSAVPRRGHTCESARVNLQVRITLPGLYWTPPNGSVQMGQFSGPGPGPDERERERERSELFLKQDSLY